MMKNRVFLVIILLALIAENLSAHNLIPTVSSQVVTTPVLADQSINVVKRYIIEPGTSGSSVKVQLEVKLDKDAAGLIEGFEIWQSLKDTSLLKESNKANYKRLGQFESMRGNNKLSFDLQPNEPKVVLWLTMKVAPIKEAMIKPLKLTYGKLRIGGKNAAINEQKESFHRLGVAVRRHKQGGVHTSRIPGIITAQDGSLVSVYDARYDLGRDLQGHMDIGVSRSLDGGLTWLPLEVAIDMGEFGGLAQKFNGVSDPNILVDKNTGTIYVAGLWMHGVLDETGTWYPGIKEGKEIWNHQWKTRGSQPGYDVKQSAQFLLVKSTDNGKTWSEPVNLTKMCKKPEWWLWAPAPGHGITLKDGTLVMPTQGRDQTGKAFSNITYSKDGGQTWTTTNPAVDRSTTECMAVELDNGDIMLNIRSNLNTQRKGADNGRAIATTSDLGVTWKEHPTSHNALIEPTCMASIHKHHYTKNGEQKTLLVFCNPDSKYNRENITLKVSKDNGETWQRKVLLDQGKSRGYSCITSIDEKTIGVLYESSQADLIFQQVSLEDLL